MSVLLRMDVFLFSLNVVLPIIILSVLGFVLRSIRFLTQDFLRVANAFVFNICLPSLLFVNIYNIDKINSIPWDIVTFAGLVTFVLFCVGFIYVMLFIKDPKQKGVILQGFFRSNYIVIGLPIAFSIAGEQAQELASVLAAFMVPFYNILAVISLTVFLPQDDSKASFFKMLFHVLKKIIKNPLIIGAITGLACLAIRPFVGEWRLKNSEIQFIFQSVENLSKVATPLALVVLGGEFSFSSAKRLWSKIAQVVTMRLAIVPTVSFFLLSFFLPHLGAVEYAALLGLFAAPSAVSSAVMAQSMGNDGELASQIVVWTSVFSAFTLFVFTSVFRAIGIF